MLVIHVTLGLDKSTVTGCPEQVDFTAGQVTCHSHLPVVIRAQTSCLPTKQNKSNLRIAHSKQNLRAACPKGKLEFTFILALLLHVSLTMSYSVDHLGDTILFHTSQVMHIIQRNVLL